MDVEKIVDKLDELQLIRKNKIIGNWYSIYCPFHNDGNEKKPSCGVLLQDEWRAGSKYPQGLFHCFTCHAAYPIVDAITKILELKHVNSTGLEWLAANVPDFNPDMDMDLLVPTDLIDAVSSSYAVSKLNTDSNKNSFVEETELAKYRYTVPYMYERKLTDKVIADYDVGVDLHWIPNGSSREVPCITFPVRNIFGNTLFICRRSIEGKLFNYPSGVTKPLYGIDRISKNCKSLIICESCFNALTAVVYGYEAVALLGTGNAYQMRQLRELGIPEYVICMDGDDAGIRAAKKLKNYLKSTAIIWTITMPPGKDINDCSKVEFDELYKNRE